MPIDDENFALRPILIFFGSDAMSGTRELELIRREREETEKVEENEGSGTNENEGKIAFQKMSDTQPSDNAS